MNPGGGRSCFLFPTSVADMSLARAFSQRKDFAAMKPLPFKNLATDCGVLALVLALAFGAGLAINAFRAGPLPLHYQSKAERLQAGVASLLPARGERIESGAIPRIRPEELRGKLGSGALVVDARPELFFRQGHLPGALSMPREGFVAAYQKHRAQIGANPARLIAVYCQTAACEDSAMVAASLRDLGHQNVQILEGGWREWSARGYPESMELAK
jgi:rhodanese-related sulfurtransferase